MMRPARMPSVRLKIVPWYYIDASEPSRHVDKTRAIRDDLNASLPNEAEELFRHRDCIPGECTQAPRRTA